MISLRLMEDTMADYKALQSWFHEPELQEFVWCDEKGEQPVSLERIVEKYGDEEKLKKAQETAIHYAAKETDRATFQAMEAFIHNLNTMHSRAGAQTPFSSINYGTDTTPEGRMVIRIEYKIE